MEEKQVVGDKTTIKLASVLSMNKVYPVLSLCWEALSWIRFPC